MQIAALEAVADQCVELESRAEAAENERDEAVERSRLFTPRPGPTFLSADPPLSEAARLKLAEVAAAHRSLFSIYRFPNAHLH